MLTPVIIDPINYGDWIADVEQPAACRPRYQLHLGQATGLLK